MKKRDHASEPAPGPIRPPVPRTDEGHWLAIRLIAAVLVTGAFALLGPVMVPLAFAMVLALALSPLVDWLESRHLHRPVACVLVMLGLSLLILVTAGLVIGQVGTLVQNLDQYLSRLGDLLDRVLQSTGLSRFIEQPEGTAEDPASGWKISLQNVITTGLGWAMSGFGGLTGLLTGGIIALTLSFYLLLGRVAWMSRMSEVMRNLGMRPRDRELEAIRTDMAQYWRVLFLLCLVYAVLMSGMLMLIGVPNALVWGLLTGLLEVVPFFGPVLAAVLPTLAALGSGGPVWQPIAVLSIYLGLQLVESNLIGPWLFGHSVNFDPVLIIIAILFFGLIWGPAGLPLAVPMLIVVRGLISITPDTPSLDALVENDTRDPELQAES